MWRYSFCTVKLGPFDGRLFIILLVSLLTMPVIGFTWGAGISLGSLIFFWFVERLGLDVNMVLRWLVCWCAGNYHTSAGARFDQPRKRWTTLPFVALVVALTGNYPDIASADFLITDKDIANKVDKLNFPQLKPGQHVVFPSPPCKNEMGVINLDTPPNKVFRTSTRGSDIPLKAALKAILPKGWHADKTYDVDGDLPITWSKAEPFTDVLEAIAKHHNLSIRVSWKKRNIRVDVGCTSTPDVVSGAVLSQNNIHTESSSLLPTKVLPPPIPAKPSAFYMLRTGQQMSNALREWCVMANQAESSGLPWTVKWEAAKDQTIEADSLYGTHIEDAINKLETTIIGNNLPFRIAKWPNHVIKVTN